MKNIFKIIKYIVYTPNHQSITTLIENSNKNGFLKQDSSLLQLHNVMPS